MIILNCVRQPFSAPAFSLVDELAAEICDYFAQPILGFGYGLSDKSGFSRNNISYVRIVTPPPYGLTRANTSKGSGRNRSRDFRLL